MEISHDISASYDDLKITISSSSFDELDSEQTAEVDDATVCIGSHDDVDISIDSGGSVDIVLTRQEIRSLLSGEQLNDYNHGIEVSVSAASESPLEYIERTWNEPRFGESPAQHFNRINGGAN